MNIIFIKQCRSKTSSKKGVLGIETLIIFIAMLMVAAIAAGVLLRTQSTLQQRALAVGNEVRERLITGVELISITANANSSAETMNEFELAVRLKPGSYDVDMKTLWITFTTDEFTQQAILQSESAVHYKEQNVDFINTTENITSEFNLDADLEDTALDKFILVTGNESPDNLSGIKFYLSSGTTFIQPLGINFTDTNQSVDNVSVPIIVNSSQKYSPIVGFITVNGTTNGTAVIDTTGNWTAFKIHTDSDVCTWDTLVPDYRFCYINNVVNDASNTFIQSGDLVTLRYKLSAEHALGVEERINLKLLPKSGNYDEYVIYTPAVISQPVETIWP